MKLLVLAQTPPPVHGQSIMAQILIEGLPGEGIALKHVEMRLSRDAGDIGRWRSGKIFATLGAAFRTIAARFQGGCDTLYYIPAPGKRAAVYRDWAILLLCRPFFKRLVLHWHATGLGKWITDCAWAPERGLTRALLGGADLSIALADSLRDDAQTFRARKIAVVPNAVVDPGRSIVPKRSPAFHALFIGLGSEEKGLFVLADAILAANQAQGATPMAPAFTLTVAGAFDSAASAQRFEALVASHPTVFRHVGIATGPAKSALFAECNVVCCPSWYSAEGMPLVLLEALAHDRPIIGTRWRAIPDIITTDVGLIVEPRDAAALTAALLQLRTRPPAPGVCRQRFEASYSIPRHLARMAAALQSLS